MYRIIGDLLNWKIAIHAPKGKCIIQLMYVHMIVVFYIENHSSICPNLEVNNFNFLICLSCDLKEEGHSVDLFSKRCNFWKLYCIAKRYCFLFCFEQSDLVEDSECEDKRNNTFDPRVSYPKENDMQYFSISIPHWIEGVY